MAIEEIRIELTESKEPAISKNGLKQIVRRVHYTRDNQLLFSGTATITTGEIMIVCDYPQSGLIEYSGNVLVLTLPFTRSLDDHSNLTSQGEERLKRVIDSLLSRLSSV